MSKIAVHPNVGYLNTEFTICVIPDANTNTGINRIEIYRNNISVKGIDEGEIGLVKTIDNINCDTIKLKLESAGLYNICAGDDSVRVVVKDAIRFGGSKHKGSYVFDSSPWCFIVMQDRTYFYNRDTEEQYVEAISPDKIDIINENVILIRSDKNNEYSLYSLVNHRIFANYSKGEIVNNKWLVTYLDSNELNILHFDVDDICDKNIKYDEYIIDSDSNNLYIILNKTASIFSLDAMEISNSKSFSGDLIFFANKQLIIEQNRDSTFEIWNIADLKRIYRIEARNPVFNICNRSIFDIKAADLVFDDMQKECDVPYATCIQRRVSSITDICVLCDKTYYIEAEYVRHKNTYGSIKNYITYNIIQNGDVIYTTSKYINTLKVIDNKIFSYCSGKTLSIDNEGRIISSDGIFNRSEASNDKIHNSSCAIQNITAESENGTYVISIRGSYIYLYKKQGDEYICKEILTSLFDRSSYGNVLLSDDGENIVYQEHKQLYLQSVATGEVSLFPNQEFVSHYNGYRPLVSFDKYRRPVIIDPITRQSLDSRFLSEYNFVSPDGLLYAETSQKIKYYHKLKGEFISRDEYETIRNNCECLYNTTSPEKKREILEKRKVLLSSFPNAEHLINVRDIRDEIAEERGFVVIKNVATNDILDEIPLGKALWFLNYVSFSYDNRYVGIAGRYPDNTIEENTSIKGLFMVYDLCANRVMVRKTDSYACWRTLFTQSNVVASYSSNPNTYIGYETDNQYRERLQMIIDKNVLTFSPDGKYMALSNQGYIRYNGGSFGKDWGHMPSTDVYIRAIDDPTQDICPVINDLSDYGEGISGTLTRSTTASCSFSADNKKLMMVGSDGVVIIRNLYLE